MRTALWTWPARKAAGYWAEPHPIRSELFSGSRLQEHARSLAAAQVLSKRSSRHNPIPSRLRDNEQVLLTAYREIAQAVLAKRPITPAAEWLLDNYHIIEQQVRQVRADLPAGYYRRLPKLAGDFLEGFPRVFGVVWAYIAHTDSRFDPESLQRFLLAYQEVQPLTIGELWAVPITLRILLIENLRRLTDQIMDQRREKDAADELVARLLGTDQDAAQPSAFRDYKAASLSQAFLVQLMYRLRDRDPLDVPAVQWLEEHLRRTGLRGEELMLQDTQLQSAANVSVRNIITSMRLMSDVDWSVVIEAVSTVDAVLRGHEGYGSIDFVTRNLYRTAIEQLADRSDVSEVDIARRAVRQSVETAGAGGDPRQSDPGYWLIGPGRERFETELGFRRRFSALRALRSTGLPAYIALALGASGIFLAFPVADLAHLGVNGATLFVLVLVGTLLSLEAGLAIVNAFVTTSSATRLPSLDLQDGVPEHLRTMVVIPTLLSSPEAIDELLELLEVHYLANPRGAVQFALLTDWTDAASETVAGDDELLQRARGGVEQLNRRYPAEGTSQPRFLLFHRRRLWNAAQGKWMGWERKRGKLHELNRLLRGATDTSFVATSAVPADVRYVITLDSDTRLPRDSVQRLVGKMAHPLNRAVLDQTNQRVVDGYAILQPRVTPSLAKGTDGSVFQQIFSANSGIDPYASAISDVYQDLFGEGTYTGKGIYDIDAFEFALQGRVPENALLSHDLFEGTFARAGLVSDVEVVEDYPIRYDVASARQHRWVRGDWQLLRWILDFSSAGPQALPLLSRWKMIDNLRRSLTPHALLIALAAGWLLPIDSAAMWTIFVLLVTLLPTILPVAPAMLPRRAGMSLLAHFRALAIEIRNAFVQTGLLIVLLPHQAWVMGDAIIRTLWRLFVSRRRLLDWTTAQQAQTATNFSLLGYHKRMAGGLALAVLVGLVAWSGSATVAAPFLVAWLLSPTIAYAASLPQSRSSNPAVKRDHALRLRVIARRTWRFFETFVTADEHHLPPDNFQDDPSPVVAHRTSPTNMGLYLLSVVSANDFGWIGRVDALERIENTLRTMERLPRHRGHFYNWYDTQSLAILQPAYVSSVDSGNLAGHLLTLANVLSTWAGQPVPSATTDEEGVRDALRLARTALAAANSSENPKIEIVRTAVRMALETKIDFADAVRTAVDLSSDELSVEARVWLAAAAVTLASHRRDTEHAVDASQLEALARRAANLEQTARSMALAMDFEFLFDHQRLFLVIGYSGADDKLDPAHYDLLASEARLASLVAIAKGDVPTKHWFRLGRELTSVGTGAALVSWSGSMFEYLMPSLVMRAPAGSLLEQSNERVVLGQRRFAHALDIPWGISEAAYNARDTQLNYQYSNFGVPGLGFKRGLSENLVVAPYATALAAMVDAAASLANFERLESLGALGDYGFCESIDFTPTRVPEGARFAIVQAWMAHHQGMTIVALANAVFDGIMRSRFHGDPLVQSAELLLEERAPRAITVSHPRAEEVRVSAALENFEAPVVRRIHNPHAVGPSVHVLSNGHLSSMLTAAGSGYVRWGQAAVTRWREDATRDDWGFYFYLTDQAGAIWSPTWQPVGTRPDHYEVIFSEDRAEFRRRERAVTTVLDVLVSPEDDAEARRLTLHNEGDTAIEIAVTSYAELVLAPDASDIAHQTFSKLFVQTEFFSPLGALLATRRRRTPEEPEIWVGHLLIGDDSAMADLDYETDRARFLGRGNGVEDADAIFDGGRLSNSVGQVLDPVFALRRRISIAAGRTARLTFWTAVASTRDGLIDILFRHADTGSFERASTLAWTQAHVQLRHLGISPSEASLFQRAMGYILYSNAALRSSRETIRQGMAPANRLWPQSISGDLPIVLVRITDEEELGLVRESLRAFEYWRLKGVPVDLVILNERSTSYIQDLQGTIEALARATRSATYLGVATVGRVFTLRADLVSAETRAVLLAVARMVLIGRRGNLGEQLNRVPSARGLLPPRRRRPAVDEESARRPALAALGALRFFNGVGGFSPNGREYVTVLAPGRTTPAPWINVVSGPNFGFQVSADGGGYTWSSNSRDNQLTPWSNDPVADRPGEIIYLQDRDDGTVWTPTASPIRLPGVTYLARHGWGYSRFEVVARGLAVDMVQFVPLGESAKAVRLTIRNMSNRRRRLTVTGYVEWVLGLSRGIAAPTIVTETDAETEAIFARNPWNMDHGKKVAYFDMGGRQEFWTADRSEFIGRNGTTGNPAALSGSVPLSGRAGGGLDPCGVLQTNVDLEAGAIEPLIFFLGQADDNTIARAAIVRLREADLVKALSEVTAFWTKTTAAIQVKTPDDAFNILVNGWLSYQALACRLWARSAFYQASGAYGFRDQLQDVMSFTATRPDLARAQILRAAARQFVEGDVQHWWFEPSGRGVRTRISDDLLWLPYVTAHYIQTTGEEDILDQQVPFLEGAQLKPGDHDLYYEPEVSAEVATLFEHCARAIDRSLATGAHGLPLIGTGDWNDGMNRVGEGGKGESVWLGWFLIATIDAFLSITRERDAGRTQRWEDHRKAVAGALDAEGWDGQWYRRGFYDDGTPLGSASNDECRIDSIAQSWAVLAGAGDPQRARQAMEAFEDHLLRRDAGLSLLFTPPFDKSRQEPGYIKGYPAGIRENGGQYTHAAAWAIMAYAALDQGDKAANLFSLINPINHAATPEEAARYKVEPYVVAADVYSIPPHEGRGGWTWYTGSAGWLYRAAVESILGIRRRGDLLIVKPCLPSQWPGYEAQLALYGTTYSLRIIRERAASNSVRSVSIDGRAGTVTEGSAEIRLEANVLDRLVEVRLD